jgi:biotin carboxylase
LESGIVLFMGMVRRGESESLQRRGLPLGLLLDTNSKARLGDVSGFALVERFDFSRPLEDLVAAVRGIQQRARLRCLFNVIEFYVAQTAEVAAALGLPNLSPATARLCLDKNLMRQRFRERLGPTAAARFQAIASEADLLAFAGAGGYPVFLQPANVSASMWATRNHDQDSLLANYRTIVTEVPPYYERLGKKGMALQVSAAEYLQGANTSIDCLIDQRGRVFTTPTVDVLTGQDIGIDDYHHFARVLPSRLSVGQQEELDQLAVAGCQALEMTACAAHVEFIGNRLGEIGARPGGNRPRILELAYGMDELYAYYQVLTGQPPTLTRTCNRAAALVSPFPAKNGTLRAINHLDALARLPGYLYHEVRAQPGQAVGMAKGGFRAPLYVELMSPNADDVRRGLDQFIAWSDLYVVE